MRRRVRGLLCGGLLWAAMGPAVWASDNLLINPGFEVEAGWRSVGSASLRNKWRSHDDGKYNAAILGGWATQGDSGYIEQIDLAVRPGAACTFEAWVWSDLGWSPSNQTAAIRFHDVNREIVATRSAAVRVPRKEWTLIQVVSIAPTNAIAASVIISADGISPYGSLAIDDTRFVVEP